MLKKITIENLKSIKHLDYECSKLNLLTGLNGAGKSSFVQALLFLRAIAPHADDPACEMDLCEVVGDAEGATFDDIRYCYAKSNEEVRFSVDFDSAKATDRVESGVSRFVRILRPSGRNECGVCVWEPDLLRFADTASNELSPHLEGHRLEDSSNLSADGDAWLAKKEALEKRYDQIKRELISQEAPSVNAYREIWRGANMVSAFRGKPQQVHSGVPKGSWLFGVRFNPEGDDVGGFLAEYGMQCYLDESHAKKNPMIFPGTEMRECVLPNEDRKYTFLLDQIQLWLNEISPGAKVSFEKKVVGSRSLYIQSVGYGEKKFKPENVGFGVSDILPVLTAVLTSHPGDILIIENPESHLHPKGQAKMGELLARAAAYGIQLFVETHSDHVINGIRVAVKDRIVQPKDVTIAFFDRCEHSTIDQNGKESREVYVDVTDIKVDGRGFLSDYPDGFLDEWNNQLLELS